MGEARSEATQMEAPTAPTQVTLNGKEQPLLKDQTPPAAQDQELVDEPTLRLHIQAPTGAVPAGSEQITLEHVSPNDTVLSLRQLIAEYPALACFTCYHLEVQDSTSKAWTPLNDYIELGEYDDVQDGVTLKMVLEKYDARKVRAHVRRLRDVLTNPPIPQTFEGDEASVNNQVTRASSHKQKNKKKKNPAVEASQVNEVASSPTETDAEKKTKELTEKQIQMLRDIHEKLEGVEVPVKVDLANFYSMSLESSSTPTSRGTPTSPSAKDKKKKDKDRKSDEQAELANDAKLPQCIKSIVFSGYNPPPAPRKLAGDLMYLEVTIHDGSMLYITAHVNGFYVNRSTATRFDPTPCKNSHQAHLLLETLRKASDAFQSMYAKLLAKAAALAKQGPASIEWMVAAGGSIGGKLPWNTPYEVESKHGYDMNRAEDELCAAYGVDERGVLRDWNEEYQCCRELPASTLKDQIIRSRVMYKIVNEFVEAATQGAVAIVEGQIPPINPMDDISAHVYVFNNIFFSISIDGKSTMKDTGSDEAAFSSANRDLQGVKAFNEADIQGLHTLATAIVDYLGVRVIAQSVIPGILQGEAASKLVYGSVDGGKTIASNDKMHSLMLQAGDKLHLVERSIQPLGKDDDEESEEKASMGGGEAGTEVVKLCGPVEAKGILGSDGRMYVLDLVRITPKDWTFYEERTQQNPEEEGLSFKREDEGYVALLRPELVQLYSLWKQNQKRKEKRDAIKREWEEKHKKNGDEVIEKTADEKDEDKSPEKVDNEKEEKEKEAEAELSAALAAVDEEEYPAIKFNPNVFMKYEASTNDGEIEADEAVAKDAADYLQKVVIPAFISDVRRGSIAPADGQALSDLMHSCGINMRYLGRLAGLTKRLEAVGGISKYFLELLEVEMIARAAKHIFAAILNGDENVRSAPGATIVQILNALLGSNGSGSDDEGDKPFGQNGKQKAKKSKKMKKKKARTSDSDGEMTTASAQEMDAEAIRARVLREIKARFDCSLSLWFQSEDSETEESVLPNRVHHSVLLRRICQRMGIRVVSRNYNFGSSSPFSLEDISGVVPVVKHSLPAHPLAQAKQLLERGRIHLSGGALPSAYELLQEASNLLFQVCGAAHEDAALCSSSIATVLYHAGDVNGAIAQQQRALALYTQLSGIDYHDTAFAHANLALFLHANGQTDVAVAHVRRAIYLLELCGGPHFPEISSLYFKMGMMCQDVGQITLALLCHRESLRRGEFDRLQAANTLHQMALACGLAGGYREALAYEKKVYSLYKEAFGDSDPRTVESSKYMAKFTEKAVEGAKGRREIDAAAAADAIANELLEELAQTDSGGKKKNKKSKGAKKTA